MPGSVESEPSGGRRAGGTGAGRTYVLVGADGREHRSAVPGTLGGHRRNRIYGRLDCRVALRWVAPGTYARHRVFFADGATAVAAGYRPCSVCLPGAYARWRAGADRLEAAL